MVVETNEIETQVYHQTQEVETQIIIDQNDFEGQF